MKFYIKQKIFTLKDRFSVMDENGKDVYQVQGKLFSLSNKMELLNMNGSTALLANKKVFSFLPKYFIYSTHNELLAEVNKKFALKPKFQVLVGNEELTVEGSFFGHSFGILKDQTIVASITKKILSFGDTYEIDIDDNQNVELFLFIVIIIDQVIHEQKNNNSN
jgi:uncharacterized protein YxjI